MDAPLSASQSLLFIMSLEAWIDSVPSDALSLSCCTQPGLTEATGNVTPTAVSTVLDTVLLL